MLTVVLLPQALPILTGASPISIEVVLPHKQQSIHTGSNKQSFYSLLIEGKGGVRAWDTSKHLAVAKGQSLLIAVVANSKQSEDHRATFWVSGYLMSIRNCQHPVQFPAHSLRDKLKVTTHKSPR